MSSANVVGKGLPWWLFEEKESSFPEGTIPRIGKHEPISEPGSIILLWYLLQVSVWVPALTSVKDTLSPQAPNAALAMVIVVVTECKKKYLRKSISYVKVMQK